MSDFLIWIFFPAAVIGAWVNFWVAREQCGHSVRWASSAHFIIGIMYCLGALFVLAAPLVPGLM